MVFNTIFTNTTQKLSSSNVSIGTYISTVTPVNSLIISGNVGIGTTNPANLLSLGIGGAAFAAPSGNAPLYAARAWAVFNGTLTGTNNPTRSGNISSVLRNGNGDYTLTFTTNMPDANYAILTTGLLRSDASSTTGTGVRTTTLVNNPPTLKTSSQVRIIAVRSTDGVLQDIGECYVGIFY